MSTPKSFGPILVASDLSQGSDLALARALALPRLLNAQTRLLHVLPTGAPARVRGAAEAKLTAALDLATARTHNQGRPARRALRTAMSVEVRTGLPFVEIVRAAREMEAELLVIGRHGRGTLRDMMLGSTAERVVRKGDVPVLVVSLPTAGPYRRPLVACGLDDAARRNLTLALRVAPAAKIVAVLNGYHVPFEGFVSPVVARGEQTAFAREFEREAVAKLQKLLRDLGLQKRCLPIVRKGDPRALVISEARRQRADLIVVGTHARSGIAHALLGSVAEWVLRSAACDVLVARPSRFAFELP